MPERRQLFRDEAYARRGRSEPIDGLLRISAPHEWLFVALLGCALAGLLGWAVFGTIERGVSGPCVIVTASDGVDATARLSSQDARRIAVGMSARVNAAGVEGPLDARVARIGLSGAASDDRRPLIIVEMPQAPAASLRDGDACHLRIVTRRESPIRLIVGAAASASGLA